jgi:predicted nucleotidyltransferase
MRQKELLEAKREDILHLAKQYGAYNVRVFGSVVRGEVDERSGTCYSRRFQRSSSRDSMEKD